MMSRSCARANEPPLRPGQNAIYVGGRNTGLIPLSDQQAEGEALRGAQFPTVFPHLDPDSHEWEPLRPSLKTLGASLVYAARAGAGSFSGSSWRKMLEYTLRVTWFAAPWNNFWDFPVEAEGSERLSLDAWSEVLR